MMKRHLRLGLALLLIAPFIARAEETEIVPDLAKISDPAVWKIHHAAVETLELDGKRAVRLKAGGDSAQGHAGLALINGLAFRVGKIELDVKGKNIPQASFLGLAFNVVDENTFEAVYFRPFNFTAPGSARDRAVQYISWPENTWKKLRQEQPGQFENPLNPAPDPEGWFHVRLDISEKRVRVYVDNGAAPCLEITRLAAGESARPIGLFVDVAEGFYANIKVTPVK